MWLLYNVITPPCTLHPYSPSPVLPVPLSSMITAPPGATEFESGLPIIAPPHPHPHVIVIIYKFVSVHVKYRMFHYKSCVTVGEDGKVSILNMLLVQSD